MVWLLFAVISFLLCSVPFGRLIGQGVARIDVTQKGSGNIGATNVARLVGLKWGFLTLILDVGKGFIPVFLFRLLLPEYELQLCMVGLAALLGHQFSIFQRFHGGKGVATALGIYLAISPVSCLLALILFILTVAITAYVSLGSMLSALVMPLLLFFSGMPGTLITTALIMAGLICLKHKDNIQRLIRGEESKWRKRAIM